MSIDNANVGNYAAIGVIDRVEDKCASSCISVANWSWDLKHDLVKQFRNACAGLTRYAQAIFWLTTDELCEFFCKLLWLRGRQINLVKHGNDGEVVLHRQVQVSESLGFDSLRAIHEQYCAFACSERARNFVGEVNVTRCIDHVEDVLLVI